jgi:hypothetical protein
LHRKTKKNDNAQISAAKLCGICTADTTKPVNPKLDNIAATIITSLYLAGIVLNECSGKMLSSI